MAAAELTDLTLPATKHDTSRKGHKGCSQTSSEMQRTCDIWCTVLVTWSHRAHSSGYGVSLVRRAVDVTLPTASGRKDLAAFLHPCVYLTDATDGSFFCEGVLCAPQGSKTVSCGYGTPRIPVKDTGSITHSAIICSYLKLRGCRGYLRDSGSTHTDIYTHSEEDG